MKKILFDTDVLIEHLRGNHVVYAALQTLFKEQAYLAYSVVTEAEIYHGLRPQEEEQVLLTLSLMDCLSIDQNSGRRAGRFLKKYAKSHAMDVADALIASTAVENRLALCTFNWKHYPMKEVQKFKISRE